MTATELARLADIACSVIDKARPIFLDGVPGMHAPKGDRDFATAADYAIERLIRDELAKATPGIGFVGEEDGGDASADRWWCLDPIDGTVNYATGGQLCAISLALVQGGQPVVGIVEAPRLGNRYIATKGAGATKDGHRIRVADIDSLAEAIVTFGDFAVGDNAEERNQDRLAVFTELAQTALRIRMLGTAALDLAWLAEGHTHASITLGGKSWDVAAGQLVALEAGADLIASPFSGDESTVACVAGLSKPLANAINIRGTHSWR